MFSCPECRLLIRSWLIAMLLTLFVIMGYPLPFPIASLLLFLPVVASLRVVYSVTELEFLLIPMFILWFFSINEYAPICCAAAYIFMILSVRSGRRWGAAVSIFIVGVLFAKSIISQPMSFADIIYLTSAALTIIINFPLLFYKQKSLKNIKICTDNNALFKDALKIFTFAAAQEGAKISDSAENAGNVIAYKLESFAAVRNAIKTISVKRGEKVFIISSSAIYTEIPYLFLWLALALKGAKVMGRAYIRTGYEKFIEDAGGDFAAGFKCGLPPLVPVLPLFLIGLVNFIKK